MAKKQDITFASSKPIMSLEAAAELMAASRAAKTRPAVVAVAAPKPARADRTWAGGDRDSDDIYEGDES